MVTNPLLCLVQPTIAASVAVVLVGILRVPLRRIVGARAAYWLWLMVPLSTLGGLLPRAPSPWPATGATADVAAPVRHAMTDVTTPLTDGSVPVHWQALVLVIWALGVALTLALSIRRQHRFVRSLGELARLPDGTYRSDRVHEPMVVGAWRPRVVLPADFETRYTRQERLLVLAHEHAHVQRGDALSNAVAMGWLCLCWFNPAMHWALERFRFDQELACDAWVLQVTGTARRRYADALLKTQLAADAMRIVPVGCQWQSNHPLARRIAALRHPLPGSARGVLGALLACGLIFSGSYAAGGLAPLTAAPIETQAWVVTPAVPALPGAAALRIDTASILAAAGPLTLPGRGCQKTRKAAARID